MDVKTSGYLLSFLKCCTIAELLKKYRWYRGMTQKEVAEKLGFSYQQYQKYEYGLITPKRENRAKLAATLKIDVKELNTLAAGKI